jgi:hypothetical protein
MAREFEGDGEGLAVYVALAVLQEVLTFMPPPCPRPGGISRTDITALRNRIRGEDVMQMTCPWSGTQSCPDGPAECGCGKPHERKAWCIGLKNPRTGKVICPGCRPVKGKGTKRG